MHHPSMHYFYRPEALENMCCYDFFSEINFVTKSAAKKSGIEFFEFINGHPLKDVMVVIFREKSCVPIFPWNWLGSTRSFTTSMLHTLENTDAELREKEEYAYKFNATFSPLSQYQ